MLARADRFLRMLAEVRGREGVVLDPFVGSGALLVGARERGAQVLGCDIAPVAIRQATAKLSGAKTTVKPARSSSPRPRRRRLQPVPKGDPRIGP
ncbi:MAG: DNA methyltransferase [Candidatus Limnocylindrales bacterium]